MRVDPEARTRLSEAAPDPFVGRTVAGYRVEEWIGRGGMGSVYKATQLSLGRPVALKILPEDLLKDRQFLDRFGREADILSRLSHPNVVAVYDRGEVDGRPYLVLEYVEGKSLRDVMREGPLEPDEAMRITSCVLSALAHAHEKGIVHRDIKPENVLLAPGGVVKVADFGLSRILGPLETTRLTRTQLVLGTYEYMAPEQRERAREADERSDLYATGVVLYEMLTGELPIGRFDLPSQRRPGSCDSRFDALIEKSLEKDPGRRYQSADEMAGAVSRILEVPAPQGPVPPPPPRAERRRASRPSDLYSPVKLEHHVDNLATLDHVLGTLCYFGAAATIVYIAQGGHDGGASLVLFFVVGWYLRHTAELLKKFRYPGRTSQAVIAILTGCSVILLPLSVYSFWVLFGHRGRTYYEARSRGLDPPAAARYTHRVLEEPFPEPVVRSPEPPPPPPARRRTPTPSEIPVQSRVVSAVEPPPVPRRRLSPFIGLALGCFGLSLVGSVLIWVTGLGVSWHVFSLLLGMGALFCVVGILHSLLRPRVRGAAAGFFLLLILFFASFVLFARASAPDGGSSRAVPRQSFPHRVR